ncbi:MAG TPA: hypothetical protein VMT58_08780 [Candidatus Binataceae bacterium]|nr:hypothetical protein [Candidatus Binataceae bacterium]
MDRAANQGAESRPFPDVILRSQFFGLVGGHQLSSEQRLMLAVLADAINVVQDFCNSAALRKRNSFTEAWNWIFRKRAGCPLSFDNVCDALGINAEGLRLRLSRVVSQREESPLRLRLKDASRMPRMTVNRARRRHA